MLDCTITDMETHSKFNFLPFYPTRKSLHFRLSFKWFLMQSDVLSSVLLSSALPYLRGFIWIISQIRKLCSVRQKKRSGRKRAPARHWSGLGGGRGTTARTDRLRNRLKRRAPLDAGQLRARDVNKITIIFPKKPFDLIPDRFYFFPLFFWKCISNHIVTALVQFCFSNKRHVSPWLAEASTSHRFRLFTIFIFLTHFHLRTALLAS